MTQTTLNSVAATSTQTLLKQLIELPTITVDTSTNRQALDFIQTFLTERGMYCKRFAWGESAPLLATTRPDAQRVEVLLAAHVDVVPAPPELFKFRQENDRLYGRGVFDMKCAIAAYLQVVDDLKDTLRDYDFGILITADEETGGLQGTAKVIAEGYSAGICILPDAIGNDHWNIEERAKGCWPVEIIAHGRSVHASRPWEGDNAVHKLIHALRAILDTFPNQNDPLATTVNITQLSGGEARNQLAGSANAVVDIRFFDNDSLIEIQDQLAQLCASHDVQLQQIKSPKLACIHDLNSSYSKPFLELVKTQTGQSAQPFISLGASDAPYFTEAGIPCIVASPPGGNHHSTDEWLSLDGLEQLHTIIYEYIKHIGFIR